jgi:glycosyltransferase involved in cell wall biosynthesis
VLGPRTVTVHNGVPIERLRGATQDRVAARAALGYGPMDFVVGSVARFDPRKGLDTLLEAAAIAVVRCPELRVLLVGDGPERARLEEMARALGIVPKVKILNHQIEVRSILAAMDLFAAPSRTEGLGMAIIEALAAGIPVIGSRVGGIPEVVEDGRCGRLLPAGDTPRWAEALVEIGARPAELASWARSAPSIADRFSLEKSGAQIERLYDRLLGRETPDAAPAEALAPAA